MLFQLSIIVYSLIGLDIIVYMYCSVGDILWEIEDVLVHFLNTIGAYLRNEGRNNLVGEFGAEEEEQDIIYFL